MDHDRNELESLGEFPDRVGEYGESAIPAESHPRGGSAVGAENPDHGEGGRDGSASDGDEEPEEDSPPRG